MKSLANTRAARVAYTISSEERLQQERRAAQIMQRSHEIMIEVGAAWDGMDGYTLTEDQELLYSARMKQEFDLW